MFLIFWTDIGIESLQSYIHLLPCHSSSLNKPPVTEAVYVTTEQTTSRPVAMVPEVQTQTSYSPSNSASTISGRSDDLLLPPSPPVPASRPNLVYTQVSVQQTQVPPPANDDHVQYAQLKHHKQQDN